MKNNQTQIFVEKSVHAVSLTSLLNVHVQQWLKCDISLI